MDQLPWLGKRELICLLLFTCNYVFSVRRSFLFLLVLGMGYVILLWHSLSLPYNNFAVHSVCFPHLILFSYMSHVIKSLSPGFLSRSDKNLAANPQKIARGREFIIGNCSLSFECFLCSLEISLLYFYLNQSSKQKILTTFCNLTF